MKNLRKNQSVDVAVGKRNQRRILKSFRKIYQLKTYVKIAQNILIILIVDLQLQTNKLKTKN